ncbi:hypothetical protein C2G38_2109679, partial [Gigaspora rosea]
MDSFNKLNKVKIISEDSSNSEALSTWLKGIKIVKDILGEYVCHVHYRTEQTLKHYLVPR